MPLLCPTRVCTVRKEPTEIRRVAYTYFIAYSKTRSIFKKIIVEGYRAVGSLNDSFQSSNFLLLLLFFIVFGQW